MGLNVKGRVSFFGDAPGYTDPGNPGRYNTSRGWDTYKPGIAIMRTDTLGGWWKVTAPNGRTAIVQQRDVGPGAPGRKIDFLTSSLPLFGYTRNNFPTDGVASAVYLGKKRPSGAGGLVGRSPGAAPAKVTGATPPSVQLQSGAPQDSGLAALLASELSQSSKPQPAPATPLTAPALTARAPLPGGYQQVQSTGQAPVARDSGLSAALASVSSLLGPAAKINPGSPGTPAAPAVPHPATAYKSYKGYVNPAPLGVYADWKTGRIDQGKDATIAQGHSILAIGNAKITNIQTGVQGFGTVVYYKLLDGPYKGRVVFQGHAGKPLVGVGQRVHAGQPIQVSFGNQGGAGHIEIGWGSPDSTGTLARSLGHVDPSSHYSPEGQSIADLIAKLPRVRRR